MRVTHVFGLNLSGILSLIVIASAPPALGQSNPGPLLVPFREGRDLELGATATLFQQGHIKKTDESFQLRQYESAGRYRFTDKYKANPALGYDVLFLDLDTPVETAPRNLTDVSIGFASPLHQFESGWYIAAGVGVGYAGEELFKRTDSLYGKATFIVGKEFNETTSLLVALSYDGNRTIFPDVPVPAIAFTKVVNPQLELAVGFPFTTVRYRPIDPLRFELTALIGTVTANVKYDITDEIQVFGSFDGMSRAFRIDGLDGNDRLFFEQRRLEAGVQWNPFQYVALTVAGGYAFAQEFGTGFDISETDLVYKPSDEGYVRFGLVLWP